MKKLTLLLIMLCGTVYGQTAYRFINPQYGVKDPREYLPESSYTSCVFWATFNNNPALLSSWGIPDGSWGRNNGIQTNADNRPAWTNASNGSFLFDGSNDFIENASYSQTSGRVFTAICWVKPSTNTTMAFFHKYNLGTAPPDTGNAAGWYIASISGFARVLLADGVTSVYYTDNTVILTNGWHHLAMVYDTFSAVLYIDGKEKGTTAGLRMKATTESLKVGCRKDGATIDLPTKGIVDDCRLYEYQLLTADVTNDYVRTKPLHP